MRAAAGRQRARGAGPAHGRVAGDEHGRSVQVKQACAGRRDRQVRRQQHADKAGQHAGAGERVQAARARADAHEEEQHQRRAQRLRACDWRCLADMLTVKQALSAKHADSMMLV